MSALAQSLPVPEPEVDNVILLDGVTWADYHRLLEIRGDRSRPRLTYLEGTLEIMSPSKPHESIKSTTGHMVELWCLERGVRFRAVGSWTLENEAAERAVEPDECYILGDADADVPHLAIEVIWSSRRIDKLEVYRKLGVAEVWVWRRGHFQVHALRGESYECVGASEVLEGIDFHLIEACLEQPTTYDAILAFRRGLGASGPGVP